MNDNTERQQKFWSMIKSTKYAMLTTLEDDGTMRSRPMAVLSQQDFSDGCLWFFTPFKSAKTDTLQKPHRSQDQRNVNVSFSDPSHQNYVSVSGVAEIFQDRAKAAQLWTEAMRTWFPKGLDDPQLALLRVRVMYGEYWDAPSSAMVYAYGYLKSVITGEAPKPAEHARVSIPS